MTIKSIFKILLFTISDLSRSKWLILYTLLQLIISQLLFGFSDDTGKTIVSLLNLALIFNPIISIVFSTMYLYSSREFIELLISQPIKRDWIFYGLYFGLALTLNISFLIGTGLPLLINISFISVTLTLIATASLLTFIYTAIAFFLAHFFDDKAAGLGISIVVWLFFAVFYDGLLLFISYFLSDYPLEMPLIILSILNPIDLGRIAVMLKLDMAALMGYTGAIFENFFGSFIGTLVTFGGLLIWIALPLSFARLVFSKKNF